MNTNPNISSDVALLSIMVRSAYDVQMLRMQHGIRVVANFRAKLFGPTAPSKPEVASEPVSGSTPDANSEPLANSTPAGASEPTGHSKPGDESEPSLLSKPNDDSEPDEEEAKKIIDMLRKDYKNLMAGVTRNRTLPDQRGFKGTPLISTHSELALVHNFFNLEKYEEQSFNLLDTQLQRIPIYTQYLEKQTGIGPAMAGVIISRFDPHKARHVSSFWKFAGLDVAGDGRGRSRRKEHLVEREYKNKKGQMQTRMSITYDPWLKTKLTGVLAGSFLRLGSPWRQVYDQYKHRLQTDPAREKCTVNEWKKRNDRGEDVTHLWPPGRIDTAAKRYMIKIFLADLWTTWRTMEGLPVTEPYAVAKQGHRPHAA